MRTRISFYRTVLSALPSVVLMLAIRLLWVGCQHKSIAIHRENGWYPVTGDSNDSLSLEPIVTTKDFSVLRLDSDAFGKYVIFGQIHPYYMNLWAEETEKAIGKQIAFVFNDSVISTPTVNMRIESGNFAITSYCDTLLPEIYEELNKEINPSYSDSLTRLATARLWKEAKEFKKTLTDTTFLKTKGMMSYAAIDVMNANGFNPHYAYNQVVYLKALDRARKKISIKNGHVIFPCQRGKDLNISDNLFLFIQSLFKEWNQWLDTGKYQLVKDEDGLYTVEPLSEKKDKQVSVSLSSAKFEKQPITEESIDQRAGQQVIDALSKAYGTDSTVIGDFLDSPRCPAFLEGMFFDGSTLVFQVRGDTTVARRTLEATAQSGAFRLEPATAKNFTQKQLKEILNVIDSKREKLTDECLKSNLMSWGMGSHHIHVTFIMNTPEARKAFRKKIIDSPAVLFDGTADNTPNDYIGVSDTLGILLQSDYPVYSTQSKRATFVLVNHSQVTLESGESYYITYEDRQGVWRNLPIHTIFNCVAHIIGPGKNKHLSGSLYPEIHHNKPGRYRFFYPVTFTDTGRDVTLMAEFRLTDNPQELAEGQKEKRSAIPSTQDNRPVGTITTSVPEVPTEDNSLFKIVECMPEFPGGMKGCLDFIQTEMCYPEEAKKAGIQGRVILQFIIEKDGTPAQPRIVRSVHPLLDKEALRIIRQMPKWTPGKQDGKPQRVLYTIPISFRLPKP
ncbi:TonB family protein [Bacteroides stercoris]|uniref:TonB family protein n=1 Tax=Bacteroides TaxID=816 RepID=UPI00232E5B28|nr:MULTISPECIES: TonB family protein [Bacteroides]MCS3209261.1 TonB family protein [Bacteroides stercoris]MDC2281173.1 TonB family protein [Bacteroides stercoris]MDC2294898.1 TonB family protein [Bacteroides stercoris]